MISSIPGVVNMWLSASYIYSILSSFRSEGFLEGYHDG